MNTIGKVNSKVKHYYAVIRQYTQVMTVHVKSVNNLALGQNVALLQVKCGPHLVLVSI